MADHKIKLIALDLDQTTLRRDKSLSERNRRAIQKAGQAGICITVASGRSFASLPSVILEMPEVEYAITSNGAAIYHLPTKQRCCQFLLSEHLTEGILQVVPQALALEAFWEGQAYGSEEFVKDPLRFGATKEGAAYIRATRRPVEDIRNFIRVHKNELDAVDVITRNDTEKKEIAQKLAKAMPELYITSSAPQLLELSGTRGGKRCGLEWLAEKLHILPEEMCAFGDGENDCDMVRYVGLGAAVENAHPALKAAADRVTRSNEEDGVGILIEEILGLKTSK